MNDLISREGLIKEVCGKCDGACDCCCEENCIQCKRPNMRCDFRKDLDEAPTVDAVPVVHGEWLPTNDENKKRCSRCDVIHLIAQYPAVGANLCPSCGAKMDGGNDNA